MRKLALLLLVLLLLMLTIFLGTEVIEIFSSDKIIGLFSRANGTDYDNLVPNDNENDDQTIVKPDIRSINMVTVGDITAHLLQIYQAETSDGDYNFYHSFDVIAPYLQAADLAVGDLETLQAGYDISFRGYSGYTGYPRFNAPKAFSEALAKAGFNALTLANNHALDRGYEGLEITLEHVRSLGIETFGAYTSWEERNTPLILEYNGIRIALIGYTFCTNQTTIPEGHEYCVNLTVGFEDLTPVIEDIQTARLHGADLVAVFPHWGAMYVTEPNPQRLRDAAEEMAEAGADLILGGHPHYIQPIEWFFNQDRYGNERATLVVYSMGNFISNQHYPFPTIPSPLVEYGLLLDIELSKNIDTGLAWISAVDYEITWVHRHWRHRILPLTNVFDNPPDKYNLNHEQVNELKKWYDRIVEIVETYGHSVDLLKVTAISDANFTNAWTE